jgi:hypothetical protein
LTDEEIVISSCFLLLRGCRWVGGTTLLDGGAGDDGPLVAARVLNEHRGGEEGGGTGRGGGARGRGEEDARSSGRGGRVYIRRGGDGGKEEEVEATARPQLELSLRAIADIGGGG